LTEFFANFGVRVFVDMVYKRRF